MIQAILFDFDGVVACVDIERVLITARSYEHLFLVSPRRILEEFFYQNPRNKDLDLGLVTAREVREDMQQLLWRGSTEDWHQWWNAVEDAYCVSSEMSRLLLALQGKYRLGMITDNHLGFRQWLSRRPDVNQYFDVVVCSAEVGVKKPARSLFNLALDRLGSTYATTLYIDDDDRNTHAAQGLGMPSVHFRSVSQIRKHIDHLLVVSS